MCDRQTEGWIVVATKPAMQAKKTNKQISKLTKYTYNHDWAA